MRRKTIAVVVAVTAAAFTFGACEDLHHSKVPGDAKPTGFRQLARWDSCGATGEYCSEGVILGRNGVSFDDGVRDIEARYSQRGWRVRTFPETAWTDGGLIISNSGQTKCISLVRFNILKYVAFLGAPDATTMARLIEPYETVIEVAAFECGG